VLRIPQLRRARANLAAAEAALERARRDLERTRIRAPYDCRVRVINADLGAVVGPGAVLGQVASSNEFEVRLPLSLEEYGFLKTDRNGKPSGAATLGAKVGGVPVIWPAHITRSENEVERRTLSIHVVASVEPNQKAPPGFVLPPLGLFVHAEIKGRTLHDVVPLPRKALRGYKRGNEINEVYIVEKNDTLGFREVRIRFSDNRTAYIDKGLEPGDRVILTKVDSPVAGKPLKILSAADAE
jgi:RND family efflux transporter MFP subunit